MKPVIGITLGDPAGVGPEIVVKALADFEKTAGYLPVIIGDSSIIIEAVQKFGLSVPVDIVHDINSLKDTPGQLHVLDFAKLNRQGFSYGQLHKNSGDISFKGVVYAVELCLQKKLDALVTAPICKEAWHLAGHQYDGHTGLIAQLTGTSEYRMMLSSEKLKTLHTTAHLPLLEACKTITQKMVLNSILLGAEHMRQLGFESARIAVCGLNPHAGENGIFGDEEERIIEPAIIQAQKKGLQVFGPLPADTTFMRAYRGEFDLIIAQYHDQGHIPGKLVAFDTGVNVTVGLPIVRTSVDHGTAFDIAWQGKAKYENLYCAINYAVKMTC
jgi:4-hydroxythreonine-4-phosphate dehydrogenase